MKTIFLDFDGVIRTTRSRLAALTPDGFDPTAGRLIARIAKRAEAQIVISSAWREGRSRVQTLGLIAQAAIEPELVHTDWATPVLGGARQHELDAWLAAHGVVRCYPAIDDGIGFDEEAPHLVRTEIDEGFGFSHAIRLCRILNFDASNWMLSEGIKLSTQEISQLRSSADRS